MVTYIILIVLWVGAMYVLLNIESVDIAEKNANRRVQTIFLSDGFLISYIKDLLFLSVCLFIYLYCCMIVDT